MEGTEEQVDAVIRFLEGKRLDREGGEYAAALQWYANFPDVVPKEKRKRLLAAILSCFDLTEPDLLRALAGRNGDETIEPVDLPEAELEKKLQSSEWLRNYIDYTRNTEAPMIYHIFSSFCLLGCSLGSRAWIDKSAFKLWPNYNVILIGPPAISKSTAADFVKEFVNEQVLCPVFADKITPEAIVSSLKDYGPHQFIYAPELAVFLGKQRYNEGLITLVNRIMDNPDGLRVRTMARDEEEVLGRLTVSFLGATTPFLLSGATPEQTSSSGFLSRFVSVIAQRTSREFWSPSRGSQSTVNKLNLILGFMKNFSGAVTYEDDASNFGRQWYSDQNRKLRENTDDIVTELSSRITKVHFERTAMLLHLADHKTPRVCLQCFRTAAVLMDVVSHGLPLIAAILRKSSRTHDTDFIMEQLRKAGGSLDHTKLLRACSSRGILAPEMKKQIAHLIETKVLREAKVGTMHFYLLGEE